MHSKLLADIVELAADLQTRNEAWHRHLARLRDIYAAVKRDEHRPEDIDHVERFRSVMQLGPFKLRIDQRCPRCVKHRPGRQLHALPDRQTMVCDACRTQCVTLRDAAVRYGAATSAAGDVRGSGQ